MLKKGYKICKKTYSGKYLSAFNLGRETEYVKKKYTKRQQNCGPFAVFGVFGDAIAFFDKAYYRNDTNAVILKCKYKESKTERLYFVDVMGYRIDNKGIGKIPSGTRFADEVKILKEVEIKNVKKRI